MNLYDDSQLRAADKAHTRLLQDGDAEVYLKRTNFDALKLVAERHHTTHVPQIAEALKALRQDSRSRVAAIG